MANSLPVQGYSIIFSLMINGLDFVSRLMKHIFTFLFFLVTAFMFSAAALFPKGTEAFMEMHCFDCHGEDEKKGGLDLEKLGCDLTDATTCAKWNSSRPTNRAIVYFIGEKTSGFR
jgi:hypothetical protein